MSATSKELYEQVNQRQGVEMFIAKGLMISVALLGVAGCAAIAGTGGIADSTRTGVIRDVNFGERMTPATLRVQPGDEVRWVNQRRTPVVVEFLGNALDDVTCQSGFSNLLRRQQESTTIDPNQSASLCFSRVGIVTYNARMDSDVEAGQTIESGTIRVGR